MDKHYYLRWPTKALMVFGHVFTGIALGALAAGVVTYLENHNNLGFGINCSIWAIVLSIVALISYSIVGQAQQDYHWHLHNRATQEEKERLLRKQNEP